MTEVGDPSFFTTAKALHHVLNGRRNVLMCSVQNGRVGVALENDGAITTDLDSISRICTPIQSDNIVAQVASRVEHCRGALGEYNHGHTFQAHLLESDGQVLGDICQVRLAKDLEGRGRKLAGIRVKDLDQLEVYVSIENRCILGQ
jgi:hypothetical protein